MVGVGEMNGGALVKQIMGRLTQLAMDEVPLQWGFANDVQNMKEKMLDLVALMHDADNRLRRGGPRGEAVERWLMKLSSAAYDVESVLDELATMELIKNIQPKLKLFFSVNNQVYQRITIPHKIKNVRVKVEEVEREGRVTLDLVRHEPTVEGNNNNNNNNETSVKTVMVGRDGEVTKIMNLLLRSEANECTNIIPIIGLGGIGKTTLAESVLVDKRVGVFDVQAWVHVSKDFNLKRIGSAIIRSVDKVINLEKCPLQFVHEKLTQELASKRYLIVLDDLWEEDLNKLGQLWRMLPHNIKGSKIIVTARNRRVVESLGTVTVANIIRLVPESDRINLGVLSDDDCWIIMKQRAFNPGDNKNELMENIGREIAKNKCGGLPLVANALGQIMSELKADEWEKIRDTPIDANDTFERLKFSYNFMKLEIKMCFTYLAAFPKDFVMKSGHLIQQWIALGYIQTSVDGQKCINNLIGMSFLQNTRFSMVSPSTVQETINQELTMHDLVHELARKIMGNEFLVLDATKLRTADRAMRRSCRHAQLINYHNQSKVFKLLPHKVRSLQFRDSEKVLLPRKAFSRSKYMRVLDLSGCSSEGQSTPNNILLPSSIHRLKLLRYLDATGLPITSLPKYFHILQNMQSLILSNCSLQTLPDNICYLHKLCYLDLSGNSSLIRLPATLEEISELSFLDLSRCPKLEQLPESIWKLRCLHHLDISRCCSLQNLPYNFGSLPNISFLNMSGCSELTKLPDNFGSLPKLSFLNSSGCSKLTKLPDNFGSLPKLSFLNLSGCSKLTKLPDCVSLQYLKHLNLASCHKLENLPEDFGNLTRLEFLNLSGCYKVSMLPESFCKLIILKDLNLSDCHNLKELPECFGQLSELESLNLTSCSMLQLLPESLCKMLELRHLNLSYCISLLELPSSLSNLKLHILDISYAIALIGLPDGIDTMTSLSQLKVSTGNPTVWEMAEAIKKNLKLPTLTNHIVQRTESERCSSIVGLEQLTCHELEVVNLQNIKDPEDAERAKLRDKSDLRFLSLKWGYVEEDIPVIGLDAFLSSFVQPDRRPHGEEDKSVLERLVPPRTLERLLLQGYLSKDFPNWMCDISSHLPSLTMVGICGLGECETVPPFGRLPNLRSLYLGDSHKIRKIGREFYGDGVTCMKLRVINLSSMENLEEWWTTLSGTENEEFLIPNLHSLTLTACPKLKFLPYPPRSITWDLDNSGECFPEGGFGEISSLVDPFQMVLTKCNFSPNNWHGLQHFPTLEILTIQSFSSLRALPEDIKLLTSLRALRLMSLEELEALPECLGSLTSLKELSITDCPNLTSLPESIKDLTALTILCLKGCEGLEILPEGIGQLILLQKFDICVCSKLKSFPESMKNLRALKIFTVESCSSLRVLPECLGCFTSLEDLVIIGCPNLRFLPESMENLTALRRLCLIGCNGVEILPEEIGQLISLQGFYCSNLTSLPKSMKNLSALKIIWLNNCPGLDVLPEWLGQLTSLEELSIIRCPYVTSLPTSIQNLATLKKLHIEDCPLLLEMCQVEDAHKISHIPEVTLLDAKVSKMMELLRVLPERGSTSRGTGASTSEDTGLIERRLLETMERRLLDLQMQHLRKLIN